MRVLVDGRVLQDRYHGIGRYTLEVLKALPVCPDVELVVLLPAEPAGRLDLQAVRRRPDVRLAEFRAPVASVSAQLAWPALIKTWTPDVVFVPYHLAVPWLHPGVRVVSVVHDCILEADPSFVPDRRTAVMYRAATRLALARSDAIATISQATRADLCRVYGVHVDDAGVIPHAVGAQFDTAEGTRSAAEVPSPYVLHVGVRRPHKNQATLLHAFHLLRRHLPDVRLVLVGQRDERFPDPVPGLVQDLGLGDRVLQLTQVDDERLVDLYRSAAVFAFPSLIEGFGLPVLEAMAAGVPVVASDAPAVVEASAGAALLVPPQDSASWARAIEDVLRDPALADELRTRGRKAAAERSWESSALATLTLLRRVAGDFRGRADR
jgi:glycosyltransferase involved in cell wall biosynthesis